MTLPLAQLLRANQGATVVEFALVAPALMVLLMGLMDLAHSMYTAQMLQGAVQGAARDSTIEGATSIDDQLDANVTRAVRAVAPGATLAFGRMAYATFSSVSRPEDFTDADDDGTCNNGEVFEDVNGNDTWDADQGMAGMGGGRDAVLYTVTVTYRRPFPVAALIPGQTADNTFVVNTVLRNQPYGASAMAAPTTANCT